MPTALRLNFSMTRRLPGDPFFNRIIIITACSISQDRSDGIMETQLFMKQVLPNSFRRYTLVAENSIAANTVEAQLVQS